MKNYDLIVKIKLGYQEMQMIPNWLKQIRPSAQTPYFVGVHNNIIAMPNEVKNIKEESTFERKLKVYML